MRRTIQLVASSVSRRARDLFPSSTCTRWKPNGTDEFTQNPRKTASRMSGLVKRKAAGLPVGRKPGAKDRKPRKVSGYYLKNGR